MFLTTVCFFIAFAVVWLLSNWRYAVIWAITILGLISVQGYLTYVVLGYMGPPPGLTSI